MYNLLTNSYQVIPPKAFMPDEAVYVCAILNPFSMRRNTFILPAGDSLLDILIQCQPDEVLRRYAHIFIEDSLIFPELWHRVRPKPGTTIYIRVLPGGSGKSPTRMVLLIAVIAASFFLPGLLPAALAATPVITAGTAVLTVGSVVSAATLALGTLLVNALAPPPRPQISQSQSSMSDAFSITGARNVFKPFEPIPIVLGKHRMVPPYAALPFTEWVGKDQYIRMLFCWGYQPVTITDMQIGETPIADFEGVTIETVDGINPGVITLYPSQVVEEGFSLPLTYAGSWVTRTGQPDADEINIAITWPFGLYFIDNDGDRRALIAFWDIEYKLTTSAEWVRLYPPAPFLISPEFTTPEIEDESGNISGGELVPAVYQNSWGRKSSSPIPFVWGHNWTVAKGQYDVRIRKANTDYNLSNFIEKMFWTAMRTITNENPVKMPGLALTAIRIKASQQLNGVVDNLNAVVSRHIKDWDTGSSTWIVRQTSNPASIFREILQGPGNARPLADSRLDLETLQTWHTFCATEGLEFNMVRDFISSVWDTLKDVTAVGRATPTIRDGKWSVSIDKAQTTPVQHFTPRNSWGFAAQKAFPEIPHAWRIRFLNRDKDWRQDERIVYDDGYTAANATKFEILEMPGITHPDHVWKDGRYHLAVARLRPEVYALSVDLEHIVASKGDLVRVSHDVPIWGQHTARIKSLVVSGPNTTELVLDELVTMVTGKSYSCRVRLATGVSQVHALTLQVGEFSNIILTTPVTTSTGPQAGDLIMVGQTGLESVELVIKNIEPRSSQTALLVLVDASPAIHTADEGTIPPFESGISDLTGPTVPVISSIISDETVMLVSADGSLAPQMIITFTAPWVRDLTVTALTVRYRETSEDVPNSWRSITVSSTDLQVYITDVEQGVTYDIQAVYEGPSAFPWTTLITHTVVGTNTSPPDVTIFSVVGANLTWDYSSSIPPDFAGFQIRYILGATANWDAGTPAHAGNLTVSTFDLTTLPSDIITVMLKAVDITGNVSVNPASVTINYGGGIAAGVVVTVDLDAAGYPGTLVDATVVGTTLLANEVAGQSYLPTGGDPYLPTGTDPYLPVNYEDLTWDTKSLIVAGLYIPANIIFLPTVVGQNLLQYRQQSSGNYLPVGTDSYLPTGGASYLPPAIAYGSFASWAGILTADVQYDEIQFRVTTNASTTRGKITNADFIIDVTDESESVTSQAISDIGTRLALAKGYKEILSVSISIQTGGAVEAWMVDKSIVLGPLVYLYNSQRQRVAGIISATVQGVKG